MARERRESHVFTYRTGRPPTILVVEDDPDACTAVCDVLEAEGFSVTTAGDGRDALAGLLAGPLPELILLDLRLPHMDGWALMAEMKARPDLARIPVVVTSQGGQRVLNTAPVAAGYLEKPLDRGRLLQTIDHCLSMRSPGEPQNRA